MTVWEPGEIGLTQFVSKFAPETEKFALFAENVTLGAGPPSDEVAVRVSTTVPATALSGTGLTPLLTLIVIVGSGGGGGGGAVVTGTVM